MTMPYLHGHVNISICVAGKFYPALPLRVSDNGHISETQDRLPSYLESISAFFDQSLPQEFPSQPITCQHTTGTRLSMEPWILPRRLAAARHAQSSAVLLRRSQPEADATKNKSRDCDARLIDLPIQTARKSSWISWLTYTRGVSQRCMLSPHKAAARVDGTEKTDNLTQHM